MYTILASFIKANSVELPAIIKSALFFFLQIVKTEIVFQFDFSCLSFLQLSEIAEIDISFPVD